VDASLTQSGGKWKTCAVIGASANLLKTKYGSDIDTMFQTVVRVNQSPANVLYAPYVGTKTTLRVLNARWMEHYTDPHLVKKLDLPLEPNVTLLAVVTAGSAAAVEKTSALDVQMERRRDLRVKVAALNPKWIASAKSALGIYKQCLRKAGATPFQGGDTPSAGMAAIYMLKHACGHLTVYGFGSHKTPGTGPDTKEDLKEDAGIYYSGHGSDLKEKSDERSPHSFGLEQALIKAMAADSQITLCGVHGCRRGRAFYRDVITEPP